MAFQAGTRVDPRLMQADYSGFARAAQINAQALANLGAQIGEGIQNYQKNKQITASSLAQLEAISSARPEAYAALRESGGDVSKSISSIEKGDYKQKDVLSTLGALNAYVGSQDAQQQSRIRALQLEELEAQAEARKTPVLPFEPRERVIGGVPYVETKAGEFEPLEGAPGTPSATAAPVGRTVTLEELQQYREEGFKPSVTVDAEGNFVLTDMGTFAPRVEGPIPLSPGQEKMLEATATDLAPWGTGGKQQAEANLATYDKLITGLASGDITTRGFADLTPQALGIDDTVRQLFNPTGQDAVDNVRRVIFQGLKDTLGAQFTQREAERLVAASYNPALPEEMNIKRLQDARNILADVIQAKNDLYQHIAEGGTMANYQGVAPAAVLSSGINEVQTKYSDGGPGPAGFQAPSGLTIRERKSNRPTK